MKVVHRLSPEKYIIQKAKTLPIVECYITPEWKEEMIANIVVVREHKTGNVTLGFYLVDLACKGIKDVTWKFNVLRTELEEVVEDDFMKCEYQLAHNIIYESLTYAEDYGFYPHKDFKIAKHILEDDDGSIADMEIPLGGKDGNPLLIEHNFEVAQKNMKTLERTAGVGNFDYIAELDKQIEGDNLLEDMMDSMMDSMMTIILYNEYYIETKGKEYDLVEIPFSVESLVAIEEVEISKPIEKHFEELIQLLEKRPNNNTIYEIVNRTLLTDRSPSSFQKSIQILLAFNCLEHANYFINQFHDLYPDDYQSKFYIIVQLLVKNPSKSATKFDLSNEKMNGITDAKEFIYFNLTASLVELEKGNVAIGEGHSVLAQDVAVHFDLFYDEIDVVRRKIQANKKEEVANYMDQLPKEKQDELIEKVRLLAEEMAPEL